MAKSGAEIIDNGNNGATDQNDGEDQCKLHGKMSNEAETNDNGMELDNSGVKRLRDSTYRDHRTSRWKRQLV